MENDIEKYIILNRNYPMIITTFTFAVCLIIIFFMYISFNYNYKTYYHGFGIYDNGTLSLIVDINNLKLIIDNKYLKIGNNDYYYNISSIDRELIVENNVNYKRVILSISLPKKFRINNYILNFKIKKEDKKIIKYLLDYF